MPKIPAPTAQWLPAEDGNWFGPVMTETTLTYNEWLQARERYLAEHPVEEHWYPVNFYPDLHPETPEQRQEREDRVQAERERAARLHEQWQEREDQLQAERERAARLHLAAEQRRKGAQERAMSLLLGLMTPEERAHYDRRNEIRLTGQSGRLYLIATSSVHGNIAEVDEHGCMLGAVCVAPDMYNLDGQCLPLADGWIGQYLALKYNENHLRQTGMWSLWRRGCVRDGVPREYRHRVDRFGGYTVYVEYGLNDARVRYET